MTLRDRLELAHLVAGWGHRPEDLRKYGVTRGEVGAREAQDMLSFTWLSERIHARLNHPAARAVTVNKWLFYRLMSGFGIPIPRTLGLYDPAHGITWDGQRRLRTPDEVAQEVQRQRPAGLVLKPAGGQQGKGLLILDEIDHETGTALTRTGVRTTLEESISSIDVTGTGDAPGYVLQEPVPSHATYRALAPWTTNTIRAISVLDLSGRAHVQAAATMLGRRGDMANNWHAGGVSVGIDVRSGVMGRGSLFTGGGWTEEHPDSGARFTGTPVPDWDQVVATVTRAAVLLPGVRSLGWDVVSTPDGPVVLEANAGWDLSLVQIHSGGFLADQRIRDQFTAAGAPLPTGASFPNLHRRVLRRVRARLGR